MKKFGFLSENVYSFKKVDNEYFAFVNSYLSDTAYRDKTTTFVNVKSFTSGDLFVKTFRCGPV